ncbi:MAG: 3-deoxy-7-phosphoheptulonate synthase class II [Planctomycetales bacterium]|nr:3-deoxy-7-phosphoheptulonate synthase class II [Planctomycetales bacterium]
MQQPNYDDPQALAIATRTLAELPPLVTSWEVEKLKSHLAEVAEGQRFLLQGGDCSESFADCRSELIAGKLKILLQMSLVLIHGCKKPVIRVGRFAGQYAKPRSNDMETRDGLSLPSYRGDIVNSNGFTEADRRPNPELLLRGYERAAMTLNFIRSLIDGGFADLHHPEYWDLAFMRHSEKQAEYERLVESIGESIRFLEVVSGGHLGEVDRVEFYTSHEGLLLQYEQAQTRRVPRRTGWYNLTTHLPWIGDRTRNLDGGHIEYFRGIENPVGVKVGPKITPSELVQLIETLNPTNSPGKIVLIHRFGTRKIVEHLPALIEAVERGRLSVVWCCDPMHGNTEVVDGGYKTRQFRNILSELEQAFDVHRQCGSYLGGVHFELTGEDVTECTGGARNLSPADLGRAYRTQVDPRLNCEQALEMAMLVAQRMRTV